jgi:hypothetical protein
MRPLVIAIALCALASAGRSASVDWFQGGNGGPDWGTPVVPPSLHRPVIPARILDPGQGRSGVELGVLESRDDSRNDIYPYDANARVTAVGILTRWGLAPGGAEIGGGLDYPFFIPSVFVRYQPLGRDWPFGPWLTLEAGADAMPDYHAGASLGLGLGQLELWGAYQGGLVLDRGYSELSLGGTLHAARRMDVGGGLSWRRYDTDPGEQTVRLSVRVDFGNASNPLEGDQKTGGATAEQLLEQKRYKAAAQAYEDELEAYPEDVARWKGYATALEELGLVSRARLARQRAMKIEAGQKGTEPTPAETPTAP